MELVNHLRQALERDELSLHYQPQVDSQKGQIIGVDPKIKLAVNLSVKQFQDEKLIEKVQMILYETGLDPQYLELEITENIGMKYEDLGILRELRQLGVSISIDDFGMNYSSLSYLKRFPVTKIKLDQSFVRGIQTDEKDRAMIKTMDLSCPILQFGDYCRRGRNHRGSAISLGEWLCSNSRLLFLSSHGS
jgi:EAL domain-containing protein (putative c-di-GMP-specific phosphodiesterase class I)